MHTHVYTHTQAADYARAFDEDGQRLVAAGDYAASVRLFAMAARVNPSVPLYQEHLAAIQQVLSFDGGGGGGIELQRVPD